MMQSLKPVLKKQMPHTGMLLETKVSSAQKEYILQQHYAHSVLRLYMES